MTEPIPNSPEFAELSVGLQRIILEERAIESGLISQEDLWKIEDEPQEPKNIWGTPDKEAAALKRWLNGEKTSPWHLWRTEETKNREEQQ